MVREGRQRVGLVCMEFEYWTSGWVILISTISKGLDDEPRPRAATGNQYSEGDVWYH